MNDLSLHILDIAENSVRAGASNVVIDIIEDSFRNRLTIRIADDGKGMTAEEAELALNPFYSTKKERKSGIGLGLPLLKRSCEDCGGALTIISESGRGTVVLFNMDLDHIDRPPIGDVNETIGVLIAGNPNVDFHVCYSVDGEREIFSTRSEAGGTHSNNAPAPEYRRGTCACGDRPGNKIER